MRISLTDDMIKRDFLIFGSISFKEEMPKLTIGCSTTSNACSMQCYGYLKVKP